MTDLEQKIRVRAYELWTDEGCPAGKADAHWLEAQLQILAGAMIVGGSPIEAKKASVARPKFKKTKKRAA